MSEKKIVTFVHRENEELSREVEMEIVNRTADYTGEFKDMSLAEVRQEIGEDWAEEGLVKPLKPHEFWDGGEIREDVIEIHREISHKVREDKRMKLKEKYGY